MNFKNRLSKILNKSLKKKELFDKKTYKIVKRSMETVKKTMKNRKSGFQYKAQVAGTANTAE